MMMADLQENRLDCEKSCGEPEIPTEAELRALNALRSIKTQVRDVKKRISDLGENYDQTKLDEIKNLQHQLTALREEWNLWDERRKEAARIRMIMLGHEEPS
jgi:hypothetical protein